LRSRAAAASASTAAAPPAAAAKPGETPDTRIITGTARPKTITSKISTVSSTTRIGLLLGSA
jgi:hypothetical protein